MNNQPEEQKCYKIVSLKNGKYYSALIGNSTFLPLYRRKNRLQYNVSWWTQATKRMRKKGYHPLTFNSLASTRTFLRKKFSWDEMTRDIRRGKPTLCIFEARGRGIVKGRPAFCYLEPLSNSGALTAVVWMSWPRGTKMFEEVRLVKPIESYDGYGTKL